MPTHPQIAQIIQAEVDGFNQSQTKVVATLSVPPSLQGRGNTDAGRRCSYRVLISSRPNRLTEQNVVTVWHAEGEGFFPPSTTIVVLFPSGKSLEEPAGSSQRLTTRLNEIFAKQEWDAEPGG